MIWAEDVDVIATRVEDDVFVVTGYISHNVLERIQKSIFIEMIKACSVQNAIF